MIDKLLEPLPGFTRAYKNAKKLNTSITSKDFLEGIKKFNACRQFYEATLNGVPNKEIKEKIKRYGN